VNACLDRFYKQVKGGKEMTAKAKGVLVMPNVVKAGLVVAASTARGHYASVARQLPTTIWHLARSASRSAEEAKDFVILFMTDEALKQFQAARDGSGP